MGILPVAEYVCFNFAFWNLEKEPWGEVREPLVPLWVLLLQKFNDHLASTSTYKLLGDYCDSLGLLELGSAQSLQEPQKADSFLLNAPLSW